MISKKNIFFLAVWCLLSFSACTQSKVIRPLLDTPEHHAANGNTLLSAGKIDAAFDEFNRAKALAPQFSSAYVGLGLVYGYKNDFKNAFDAIKTAEGFARGNEDMAVVYVGMMRLYIMGRERVDQDWLRRVEIYYDQALAVSGESPQPHYFMGMAYQVGHEFQLAAKQFIKVMDMGGAYAEEAKKECSSIRRIEAVGP